MKRLILLLLLWSMTVGILFAEVDTVNHRKSQNPIDVALNGQRPLEIPTPSKEYLEAERRPRTQRDLGINLDEYRPYLQGEIDPEDPNLNLKLKQAKREILFDSIKGGILLLIFVGVGLLFIIPNRLSKHFHVISVGFRRIFFSVSILISLWVGFYGVTNCIGFQTFESSFCLNDIFSSLMFCNSSLVRFSTALMFTFMLFWGLVSVTLWIYKGFGISNA